MRAVVQRVTDAKLSINNRIYSSIDNGLLVLLGIGNQDTQEDIEWLCRKLLNLRIFTDTDGKMNDSLLDIEAEILIVSQFTLYASTKKGNRPSFIQSAKPTIAIPLYEGFIAEVSKLMDSTKVKTGVFGADMQIKLTNNGPVTITIDTQNKE